MSWCAIGSPIVRNTRTIGQCSIRYLFSLAKPGVMPWNLVCIALGVPRVVIRSKSFNQLAVTCRHLFHQIEVHSFFHTTCNTLGMCRATGPASCEPTGQFGLHKTYLTSARPAMDQVCCVSRSFRFSLFIFVCACTLLASPSIRMTKFSLSGNVRNQKVCKRFTFRVRNPPDRAIFPVVHPSWAIPARSGNVPYGTSSFCFVIVQTGSDALEFGLHCVRCHPSCGSIQVIQPSRGYMSDFASPD